MNPEKETVSIPLEQLSPDLTLLDCPVPPQLEEAIGYRGNSRYVAFHWMPGGDEAIYDDGRSEGTGEYNAYLLFVRHPTVRSSLQPYDFGSSDDVATHLMMLDRQERWMYAGTVKAVQRFLGQQYTPSNEPPVTLTLGQLREIGRQMQAEMKVPSIEEARAYARQRDQLMAEMQAWLNGVSNGSDNITH